MASKKRNKLYKPRHIDTPMLLTIDQVFEPLEAMLHRLECFGQLEYYKNEVVFRSLSDNHIYEAASALDGLVEFYERIQEHHGLDVLNSTLDVVKRIANKLRYDVMFFDADIEQIKQAIVVLRNFGRKYISRSLGAEMVKRVRLKQKIEERSYVSA